MRRSSCSAEGSLNKFSILPFIKLILLLLFFRVHPLCTTARRRIPESGDFAQSRAARQQQQLELQIPRGGSDDGRYSSSISGN